MSKIHFLPVKHGDSFVLECDNGNEHGIVVVDGGPRWCGKVLQAKLKEVGTPDLMVMTHFDDDHIQGLIEYIQACQGESAIPAKEVWANCAGDVKVEEVNFSPVTTYSAKQGVTLARLLEEKARKGKLTWKGSVTEGFPGEFLFASIEVVSPTEEMQSLAIGLQEKEAENMPIEADTARMKMTREDDIAIPLDVLAKNTPSAPSPDNEKDIPNASSIAFILRCKDLSILMLGDSFPHNVEAYLRSQGYSEDNPLEVDFVKVAHHGSKHNTSNELLDIIKCNRYLISTNGSVFKHPDRDSIAHILCHPRRDRNEKVHLYFNCAVETIEKNGKKKFLNEGEDVEWNFEIHENANLISIVDGAPVVEPVEAPVEEPVEVPVNNSNPAPAPGVTRKRMGSGIWINQPSLDTLTKEAKASPDLYADWDLRNSASDQSVRKMVAIEPGAVPPIHRHTKSSEIIVCLRGHCEVLLYEGSGREADRTDLVPGGFVMNIPMDRWHCLRSSESGTVVLECRDGAWEELAPEDILTVD